MRDGVRGEFHHVRLPHEPQTKRAKLEGVRCSNIPSGFDIVVVNALMLPATFGSERVFIPDPLQVNQRPLTLAKRQMLQRGNREKIVLGEHKNLRRTPATRRRS
jgi:hypothetical protein